MPQYSNGDEKKYFPTVIAALIVAAIAIASFIYSFIKGGDTADLSQPAGNGTSVVKLNPGSTVPTPKSAPSVTSPTIPAPAN